MPFINISIVREVLGDDPAAKKAEIAAKVADAITAATGLAEQDVWIVFNEVHARDWFIGASDVESLRFRST